MTAAAQPAPSPEYLAQDESTNVIIVMWFVTGVPFVFILLQIWARCVLAPGRFGWNDCNCHHGSGSFDNDPTYRG
jgi:hypothetical protein